MSDRIIFYTNPMSRGRIARWMLEEVGAPYETVLLDYGTTMKGADYLAVNPMGKVPAICHGETVVTEGAACVKTNNASDVAASPSPGAGLCRKKPLLLSAVTIPVVATNCPRYDVTDPLP